MKYKLISAVVVTGVLMAASTVASANALDTAKKNGCLSCHAIDKKMVGPSWKDIGAKYKGHKADELIASIKQGSKGKWGTIPMPPQSKASDADIAELANYILSLGK